MSEDRDKDRDESASVVCGSRAQHLSRVQTNSQHTAEGSYSRLRVPKGATISPHRTRDPVAHTSTRLSVADEPLLLHLKTQRMWNTGAGRPIDCR